MLKRIPPGNPPIPPIPPMPELMSSALAPKSCWRRFSGSLNIAYASLTSLNIFSALALYSSDSLFLSGCHLRASLR